MTIDENIETRSYGFLIERKQDSLNTVTITARVMARESEKPHPINPATDGEQDGYRFTVPKQANGLQLDGLTIRSYRSSDKRDGLYEVYDPEVSYTDIWSANYRKVERMAKTMKRIQTSIEKSEAREAGDILMAVAKAIGATWIVERRNGTEGYRSYSDQQWSWGSLSTGRDMFRRLIEKAKSE